MDRNSEARPAECESITGTPGGQKQEKVEDRPNVGTTSPDKYPDKASGKDL
jgi:hypothetical protein